jgi:hypothetical protein
VGEARFEDVWSYLLEFAFIPEKGGVPEEFLGSAIRAAKAAVALGRVAHGQTSTAGTQTAAGLNARIEAISTLLARDADTDPEVIELRSRLGPPMDWSEVPAWVEETAKADGPPTVWVEVPLPDGGGVVMTSSGFEVTPPLVVDRADGYRRRSLEYVAQDDTTVRRQSVRRGGTLEAVATVVDGLARRYGWWPAHATVYLLCGMVPLQLPVRVEVPLASSLGRHSEVVLHVAPTTSSTEVQSAYLRARGVRRRRSVGEKHALLAAFCAARPNRTWKQKFEAWNALHPEWEYRDPRTFSRDARAAAERLLAPFLGVPDAP